MKKPICLQLEDAKTELINVIDKYRKEGVPCFLLEPIMKDLYGQVAKVKGDEMKAVKLDYYKKLEEMARAAEEEEITQEKKTDCGEVSERGE